MSGYTMTATNAPLDEMNKGHWYGQIVDFVRQPGNPNSQYGGGDQLIWKILPHGYTYAHPNLPTQANPQPKGPEYFINREIWAFTSMQFTPKTKARAWVEKIIGRPLGEGEPFDLLSLKGTMVSFEVGRSQTDRAKVLEITQYVPQHAPAQFAPPAPPQQPEPQQTYQQTAPPPQQYPAPTQPAPQGYVPPQPQQQQYQAPPPQDPNAAYAQQQAAQYQQAEAERAAVAQAMASAATNGAVPMPQPTAPPTGEPAPFVPPF